MRLQGSPKLNEAAPDMRPANDPPPVPWWQKPLARRLGFAVGGVVLGFICDALPAPARAVCQGVRTVAVATLNAPGAFDDGPSVTVGEPELLPSDAGR